MAQVPEPLLISYKWGSVAFTREQFYGECPSFVWNDFENIVLNISATSPKGQWVNSKYVYIFLTNSHF